MTRMTLLGSSIVLAVLVVGGAALCHGAPPVVIDSGAVAKLQAAQAAEVGSDPVPSPRVENCHNSGCLLDSDGYLEWPCGDDEIELIVEGNALHVAHRNATYNCCPDDIVISLSVEGDVLRLTEEEILTMECDCWCCYDVEATVTDLAPGTYTVEFCWYDYEMAETRCAVDEVVIPGAGEPPRRDPPGPVNPGGVVDAEESARSELAFDPLPHIDGYSNSGCRLDDDGDLFWPCGDDEIEFTVEDNTLHVVHNNVAYNCCLDDIVISVSQEGDLLRLTEEEIVSLPCYCICCYNVEATVVDLVPGTYTVELCWYDQDTHQIECYVDEIVVPGGGDKGPGGGPLRGDPPTLVDLDSVALEESVDSALGFDPLPRIGEYSNSGCLDDPNDPWFAPCGDDEFEFTVEGNTLHVLHRNATYNCCPDDIVISVSLEGDLLRLTEEEILTEPCWCICCYNVEATVVDLPSGEYVVEFCWFDYEAQETQCYVEEIVIP